MAEASGEIIVTYPSPEEAMRAFGSVHPDDDDFARTRVEGNRLFVSLRGKDARSLLRSADDFLACISVAEDVMNAPPMDEPNA